MICTLDSRAYDKSEYKGGKLTFLNGYHEEDRYAARK